MSTSLLENIISLVFAVYALLIIYHLALLLVFPFVLALLVYLYPWIWLIVILYVLWRVIDRGIEERGGRHWL